jgi:hypothetical protein
MSSMTFMSGRVPGSSCISVPLLYALNGLLRNGRDESHRLNALMVFTNFQGLDEIDGLFAFVVTPRFLDSKALIASTHFTVFSINHG